MKSLYILNYEKSDRLDELEVGMHQHVSQVIHVVDTGVQPIQIWGAAQQLRAVPALPIAVAKDERTVSRHQLLELFDVDLLLAFSQ